MEASNTSEQKIGQQDREPSAKELAINLILKQVRDGEMSVEMGTQLIKKLDNENTQTPITQQTSSDPEMLQWGTELLTRDQYDDIQQHYRASEPVVSQDPRESGSSYSSSRSKSGPDAPLNARGD